MLPSLPLFGSLRKHDEQRFDVSIEKERSDDHFLGKNMSFLFIKFWTVLDGFKWSKHVEIGT